MNRKLTESISNLFCLPLAVTAAADHGMLESAAPAADLTSAWTRPDAWFRHGNPSPGWPEVRAEARPGSYWWWPASAVTREDLTWNLETYQKSGWGNMGVIGIYGVKGEEKRAIPIFTPEWFGMFNHAVTEGRRLGMNIDLTSSSGWRFGGPHVTRNKTPGRAIGPSARSPEGPAVNRPAALLQLMISVSCQNK